MKEYEKILTVQIEHCEKSSLIEIAMEQKMKCREMKIVSM